MPTPIHRGDDIVYTFPDGARSPGVAVGDPKGGRCKVRLHGEERDRNVPLQYVELAAISNPPHP